MQAAQAYVQVHSSCVRAREKIFKLPAHRRVAVEAAARRRARGVGRERRARVEADLGLEHRDAVVERRRSWPAHGTLPGVRCGALAGLVEGRGGSAQPHLP